MADRYSHGHHESVLRSHTWRTAENSAGYLLPHLRSGMDLLDVGCGPGTITLDLAHRVAPGRVVGIDAATDVIEKAEAARVEVAGAEGGAEADAGSVAFATGDVYALEHGDSSFDVVHAHQVLQHLVEPVRALQEMRRVLRPGGLLAVRDSDYGAFVWSPPDPRLDRWLALYHELTVRNRAEADAGRHLKSWVRAAGFEELTVSSSTWTFATPDEREWWGGLWADRVEQSSFADQVIEYGLADRAALGELGAAFREWAAHPDASFFVLHCEVLARR